MEGRQQINQTPGGPMIVVVEGERFAFPECWIFAEIGNIQANITDYVLKTLDKRYIRMTVVGLSQDMDACEVRRGWYVTRFVDHGHALKTRESWAVLREQPVDPLDPWK